tara:strand:+ start:66 stop:911 length:846 start_codon:yes stop_codon:yes gene_type:complete
MLYQSIVLVIEKGKTMTNNPLQDLLNDVGLEVSKVKTLPANIPSQDIVDELQVEQGLYLQSKKSETDFLTRKTKTKATIANKTVDINFTYKKVKGIDVGDTGIGKDGKPNSDKNRYAVYIDEKFDTGVYFTHLPAIKQFEFMLKYNTELFTDERYSEFHISAEMKLPTQFQTDLGQNKCLTWTSSQGVPVMVPTITQCQNYDNSNDLKGTPFDRPNKRTNKQDLPALVQVGIVPDMNIPVLTPARWSVISQALNDMQKPQCTTDETQFIRWYMQLVANATK